MYDKPHTMASKEADRQRLAALMAKHEAAGHAVIQAPGFTSKPMPPRRHTIDPETVLKRKPAPSRRKITSSSTATPLAPRRSTAQARNAAVLREEWS